MVLSIESHRKVTGQLAKAIGCRVVSVGYRLAPEHPHPAPVTDGVAVYRALLDRGYPAGRIALSGDSAGASPTVSSLMKIRDDGLPPPVGGVPMSPPVDLGRTGASLQTNASVDSSSVPNCSKQSNPARKCTR